MKHNKYTSLVAIGGLVNIAYFFKEPVYAVGAIAIALFDIGLILSEIKDKLK